MTRRLSFNGIVQGIGFRPTAQRLALELGIKGSVQNSGGNVLLIISSDEQALDNYVQRLIAMFDIKSYTDEIIEEADLNGFKIVPSSRDDELAFITPDLATCKECEKELRNKSNYRYRHPFISCTKCGPRYSIIRTLPYDRENTAMDKFDMCKKCSAEYTEPENRRCHAQTIACNSCGPKTSITIEEAVKILNNGEVLAVKDIGGYHLCCKTDNTDAVKKIRELKGREEKPFAVMFSSVDEIEEYCFVNDREKELLLSPARPIVLLDKKKDFEPCVCSKSDYIGAFLPCNPIQIMLLNECSPLVMTSANISSSPIITDDEEIKKLNVKTLSHNREILTPLDDSIVKVVAGRVQFIRRARGYTPLAIEIESKAKCDTLCLGGDLKAAFAYHKDKYVFLSQHFGDLENAQALEKYKESITRFGALHGFKKDKIVSDMHPSYFSSRLFYNDITIQHHMAHIASVIAEKGLSGKVLGFAFDGTGYGCDGAVWGSEVLLYKNRTFERKEHLDYTKMPASDEIAKNADLALACYLKTNELINKAIEADINTVLSSSMGRLFDAVSALLDICHSNSYEGECACALESAAKKAKQEFEIPISLNPVEILNNLKKSTAANEEKALGFHMMICRMITQLSLKYRSLEGVNQIALSGGVFNNKIITESTIKMLEAEGFDVYINELVPCGDGSIALGQAFISDLEE